MSELKNETTPATSPIAKLWAERRPLIAEYERLRAIEDEHDDDGAYGAATNAVLEHDNAILVAPVESVADVAMQVCAIMWRSHRYDFENTIGVGGYVADWLEAIARAGVPPEDIPAW